MTKLTRPCSTFCMCTIAFVVTRAGSVSCNGDLADAGQLCSTGSLKNPTCEQNYIQIDASPHYLQCGMVSGRCLTKGPFCAPSVLTIEVDATSGTAGKYWVKEGNYMELPGPPLTGNAMSDITEATLTFTLECTAATDVRFQAYSITEDSNSDSLWLNTGSQRETWQMGQTSSFDWSTTSPAFIASPGTNLVVFTGREDNVKVQKFKIVEGEDECKFQVAMYVTGCEDNAWNGEYVTSGSDHWKKDETHEIYALGGAWRLADRGVAVYATGTSAAQPTDATYEKGCIVSSSRAVAAC